MRENTSMRRTGCSRRSRRRRVHPAPDRSATVRATILVAARRSLRRRFSSALCAFASRIERGPAPSTRCRCSTSANGRSSRRGGWPMTRSALSPPLARRYDFQRLLRPIQEFMGLADGPENDAVVGAISIALFNSPRRSGPFPRPLFPFVEDPAPCAWRPAPLGTWGGSGRCRSPS